jgi:hypothetical protein
MKPLKKKVPESIIIMFVLIAVILAVIGFISKDYLFYIRTGIFLIASLLIIWINKIIK